MLLWFLLYEQACLGPILKKLCFSLSTGSIFSKLAWKSSFYCVIDCSHYLLKYAYINIVDWSWCCGQINKLNFLKLNRCAKTRIVNHSFFSQPTWCCRKPLLIVLLPSSKDSNPTKNKIFLCPQHHQHIALQQQKKHKITVTRYICSFVSWYTSSVYYSRPQSHAWKALQNFPRIGQSAGNRFHSALITEIA